MFVNWMEIVGCDVIQALNLLVDHFQGHFFNKQCASGDIFAVSEAKCKAALVGLHEAGYVAADAKSWSCFHLLSWAECKA